MSDNNKGGVGAATVVTAALIGGLAGAVVGMLLAPKSGRELRRDISEKAHDVWDVLEDATSRKVEKVQSISEDIVEEGKRLVHDLKTVINECRKPEEPEQDLQPVINGEVSI